MCSEVAGGELARRLLREEPNAKYDNIVHGSVQVRAASPGAISLTD